MPSKNPLAVGYTKLYDFLQFLEHPVLRTVLIIVLVVYNSTLLPIVNVEVSKVLRLSLVKLLVVVVIVLFAMRDPVLAILLAMALVISTCSSVEGMDNMTDNKHKENDDTADTADTEDKPKSRDHLMKLNQDTDQNNDDHETFDNPQQDGPSGFNVRPNCLSGCTDGDGQRGPECTAVQTFNPELNAQGLNCPQGYGGNLDGSPW